MIKNGLIALGVALVMVLAPAALKWGWFYPVNGYKAPTIAELNPDHVQANLPEYNPTFTDNPIKGAGEVIIDLGHDNNLQINDFNVLRTRLEARGVTVTPWDVNDELTLMEKLPKATGLIVVAPTAPYSAEERQAILEFVEDGGLLLLAADPTRPVPPEESDFFSLFDIFFAQSAVPAVNSLATAFGLTYVDDFLYSLDNNSGNYRHVKFEQFASDSPLSDKLQTVVMFSAYSILGAGTPILQGDEHINSLVRTNEQGLSGAVLAQNERVLALGDVTWLTAPYNTIADNNQFLSNIANWLAHDGRVRDLEDFPYLFKNKTVRLVQTDSGMLDPRLIAETSYLQPTFDQANLKLVLSSAQQVGKDDVIYVGTFDQTDLISPYLKAAGITVTVLITPSEEITETDQATPTKTATAKATPTTRATPTVSATARATATVRVTPTPRVTPTAEDEEEIIEEEDPSFDLDEESFDDEDYFDDEYLEEEDVEEEETKTVTIDIARMGTVNGVGTSLFLVQRKGAQVILIALAEDTESMITALDRLPQDDFSQCAQNGDLILCSTGEVVKATPEPTAKATLDLGSDKLGKVFILSNDDGTDGTQTGATNWEDLLSLDYEVKVWSIIDDGPLTSEEVEGYDVYILDSGDYAASENFDTLFAFSSIEDGSGILFIGSQPLPSPVETADSQPLDDLEVGTAEHPVLQGFEAGSILTLEPNLGGVDPLVIQQSEDFYEDATILFTRGPDSAEPGTPVVIAAVDELTESRVLLAALPFFRLSEDDQATFGLNAVQWLMGDSDSLSSDGDTFDEE